MTPGYYTDLYKHYATFLKTPADNRPIFIASGGHTDITEWTEMFMEKVPPTWSMRMEAISHHYYTLPTGNWDKHGNALGFTEEEWFETLWQTLRLEGFIQDNIAIMDKYDPEKKVGFYIDEWGTWYDTEEGDNPGFLYQQNSLRDAVLAAVNLNLFHKYAERVQMSNIAQMVNVLQAMILTDKEKMLLTPTYHVFKMHIPFQDATYLPVSIEGDMGYKQGEKEIPNLSASAARSGDGNTWLTLVNLNPNEDIDVQVSPDGSFKQATGSLLTADEIDAHNTFEAPERVKPVPYENSIEHGLLKILLPAKSVLVVELK